MKYPTLTLPNGLTVPQVGFGTFRLKEHDECYNSVRQALELGVRLIDSGEVYMNEEYVGEAIRDSGIPREELFIVNKVYTPDHGSYEATTKSIEDSLKRMGLEYFDMYFIHHGFGDYFSSWRAMEDLYRKGVLRSIGVSNFAAWQYEDLRATVEIEPMVTEGECHPFFHQKELREYLKPLGAPLVASETLAQGLMGIFSNPLLVSLSEKYNKSVAQIVLRWHIQSGNIIIPRSSKPARVIENYDIFDFSLTDADMKAIDLLDTGKSIFFNRNGLDGLKAIYTFGKGEGLK